MKFHLILARMATIRKTNNKAGKDIKKMEPLYMVGECCHRHNGNHMSLKKLKVELSIPVLSKPEGFVYCCTTHNNQAEEVACMFINGYKHVCVCVCGVCVSVHTKWSFIQL